MAIISGTITVATPGSRVQAPKKGNIRAIIFKARDTNTGATYLGGPNVSAADGLALEPSRYSNQHFPTGVPIDSFWADTTTAGNQVDFIATE